MAQTLATLPVSQLILRLTKEPPLRITVQVSAVSCNKAFLRHSISQKWTLLRLKGGARSLGTKATPRVVSAMSQLTSTAGKKVLVPIGNGTEEMEAVIVIDLLRRAGASVTVASVEADLLIYASRKVMLVADKKMAECKGDVFDLIVLPGGMPGAERLRDNEILRKMVEQQAESERFYAAICAAPAVALKPWGLLIGKKATAHPAFAAQLDDTSAVEERVVEDGLLTTSRGPGTAFEFGLSLIDRLYGSAKASEVKGGLEMRKGDGSDTLRRDYNTSSATAGERSPKVLVPICDDVEEMEAVIIIDVLRRAGADVMVACIEPGCLDVVASRGVKIRADSLIENAQNEGPFDLIALPGGPGAGRMRDSSVLDSLLRSQAKEGRFLAAVCASPVVVLHSKGLLEGRKATAHSSLSGQLSDQSAVTARVVSDGPFITSQGPGSTMEFALVLVERLFGREKADEVSKPMVLQPDLVVPVSV
eukprot:TRINITY_DN29696_c0_g1_i1.p1 TRINITY_DN29696_c0_g1~~TRINITY_DN29696_c0_g1_i1.p1  ORF type:complete len:477 (-),score=83.12 TRINITY_DN29696_c0_g1_i1:649-2079(-)